MGDDQVDGRLVTQIDLRAAFLGAGAALVASLGMLVLLSMALPLSPVAHWASRFLPLANVHAARAEAALSGMKPAFDRAEAETGSELRVSPLRLDAWLRIAFVHARRNGGKLDERARQALKRSYDIDPFDQDLGLWRLGFIFNHWRDTDRPIRQKTIEELSGLWSIGRLRHDLHDLPDHISASSGRLAAGLQINHLASDAIHH